MSEVEDMVGQLVIPTYSAGFIVLSYFVSVVGCWTALELLHKRTSTHGLYNWYLLLGAATAMGAVAIWSMHFIGNRAINMDKGQGGLQIAYNPAFTAGSFFLPICVVGIAFYLFTVSENVSIWGTLLGGLTTGLAICGMHYMGQGGIANYTPTYDWRYIIGSAITAVIAATLALGVFFHFKFTWTDTWWKRMSCAYLLAAGVSGMHWIATVGTSYRFKSSLPANELGLSREATVIVTLCLAIGCCVTIIVFAAIGQRSRQRSADRAQQVVLACAIFDPDGRLMVTPEGVLPCRKITNSYMERSLDDVFSIEHPVFCWIFRASRCWTGVTDLIPGMRNHLRTTKYVTNSCPGTGDKRKNSIGEEVEDYSQAFKELFCVAAYDLATTIQVPLEKLGVLYEDIMSTGTLKKHTRANAFHHASLVTRAIDIEKDTREAIISGKGQLLFVVRDTTKLGADHLQAAGFRFAIVPNIIDHLARSIQVTPAELCPLLDSMRNYSTQNRILEPGVHLACFALRPLFQRGFDVLVCCDAKNLLPTVSLPVALLERWHIDFICRLDDWTVAACLELLRKGSELGGSEEQEFAAQLYDGLIALAQKIENPFFLDARLTARPLRAPCRSASSTAPPGQAMIIAFRVITDVHQTRTLNQQVEFTSSRFLLCQQHVYPNAPDHAIFARRIHREFALLNQPKEQSTTDSRGSMANPGINFFHRKQSAHNAAEWNTNYSKRDAPNSIRNDNSSEKSLVEAAGTPYGGIHVSNEISVDFSEVRRDDRSPDIEMVNLGVHSEASVAPLELESFVDELMGLTIGERRLQR